MRTVPEGSSLPGSLPNFPPKEGATTLTLSPGHPSSGLFRSVGPGAGQPMALPMPIIPKRGRQAILGGGSIEFDISRKEQIGDAHVEGDGNFVEGIKRRISLRDLESAD